jgi:hypothetical protein
VRAKGIGGDANTAIADVTNLAELERMAKSAARRNGGISLPAAKIIRAAHGHGLSLPSSCADNRSRRKRAVLGAGQRSRAQPSRLAKARHTLVLLLGPSSMHRLAKPGVILARSDCVFPEWFGPGSTFATDARTVDRHSFALYVP